MRKNFWFVPLIVLFMVQAACQLATFISDTEKFDCESKGGVWRQEVNAAGELEEWCELAPVQPVATATPLRPQNPDKIDECIAPPDDYSWSIEDFKSSSGSNGVTCNARFVVNNTSSETQVVIVYIGFDNNTLQSKTWQSYSVQPGSQWETMLNRAEYKDGVITFTQVHRLLVLSNTPGCADFLTEDNQLLWGETALDILEIPCP